MLAIKRNIYKFRSIFLYAFSMAVLVFALKWLQWQYLILDYSIEIYSSAIALFFTAFGIWIATQLSNRLSKSERGGNEEFISQPIELEINYAELVKFQFTNREYEVLQLISKGHSNSEIADILFLSLSTIKTHASNLYSKFNVRSRTQAIEKAKRLNIVP